MCQNGIQIGSGLNWVEDPDPDPESKNYPHKEKSKEMVGELKDLYANSSFYGTRIHSP
jgi:hypothetical protein